MADVSMASESDDELALEVLSGFVKTVYESAKETATGKTAKEASTAKTAKVAATAKTAKEAVLPAPVDALTAEKIAEKAKEADQFQELLFRAAKALNIENTVVEPDNPRLSLKADRILIPLDSDISQKCLSVWKKPATAKPVDWFMQRKYRDRGDSTILTMSHPPADSVVVFSASGGRTTNADNFPIPGKESKTLDSVGKKIYQAGGLGLKEANTAVVLSRYNTHLWSQLTEILELLPEDEKNKALELQKEGMAVGTSGASAALDQAEVSARTMATGVIQRRRAWFNASKILPQAENRVLDLPFDGSNLFHNTTEEVVERARKEPLKNVMRRVNFLRAPNKVIRRKVMRPKV